MFKERKQFLFRFYLFNDACKSVSTCTLVINLVPVIYDQCSIANIF